MELLEKLLGRSPARLEDVAGRELDCPCGRRHRVEVEALVNREGAACEVGPFIARQGRREVWLIADERTYAAAGAQVEASCRGAGLKVKTSVLPGDPPPHADREALGRLAFDLEAGAPPIVALGAGTITDIARFLAHRTASWFVVVPTAPSMDGYTSSVAAMLVDGVRITYPAAPPRAIFADPGIYAGAPADLVASGCAEILGKLTALADWRLAAALNGEYLCPLAEQLVASAVRPILSHPASARALMDSLLWVGVAMQLVGSSRPASGAEHHVAHYWEMRALWEGREPHSHGMRVGVASVLIQEVYRELFDRRRESLPSLAARSRAAAHGTASQIRAWYGPVAERLLKEQAAWDGRAYGARPFSAESLEAAARAVEPYLLSPEAARAFLARAGAPHSPAELGIDREGVEVALQAAKELRRRYTVLHFASELGLLEEISRSVAQTLSGEP